MSDFSIKVDAVIQLTAEERALLFGDHKKKITRFESEPVIDGPIASYQLALPPVLIIALKNQISDTIEQAQLFLKKIPDHEKPPQYVFENTLTAFKNRRDASQVEFDLYYKWNIKDMNVAKLYIEYTTLIKCGLELLDTLQYNRSFKLFQAYVNDMLDFEKFINHLENDHVNNIEILRMRELHLLKLCQVMKTSKELRALNDEYNQIEDDYHDNRLIRGRQLRFNKNLFTAQMNQIKKRETNKSYDMINETNDLIRHCDIENFVCDESTKYNLIMIDEYKEQIEKLSEKYDNDLIHVEFEVTRIQSELNYFEERWERKIKELEFMKKECTNYIESVRQRNREKIAKRLAQPWIEKARKTIEDQKRKARRLARKNKKKK